MFELGNTSDIFVRSHLFWDALAIILYWLPASYVSTYQDIKRDGMYPQRKKGKLRIESCGDGLPSKSSFSCILCTGLELGKSDHDSN